MDKCRTVASRATIRAIDIHHDQSTVSHMDVEDCSKCICQDDQVSTSSHKHGWNKLWCYTFNLFFTGIKCEESEHNNKEMNVLLQFNHIICTCK